MNFVSIWGCPKYPSPHASDDIIPIKAIPKFPEAEPVRCSMLKGFKSDASIDVEMLLKPPASTTTITGRIIRVKNINNPWIISV